MADPQANAQNIAGTSRNPAVANVAANAQAGVTQNTVPILVGQPLPQMLNVAAQAANLVAPIAATQAIDKTAIMTA
uniref:Uncharacterized protein n=1 Tax=Romanomermis culicivorax TaxID=13658 RepID=A0A915IBK0_ROMCU